MDIVKLSDFSWKARISLRDGIRKTVVDVIDQFQ
jgi:hypothetical protein